MRFLEKKLLFLIALSVAYFGVRIPLLYMCIGVSCMTHICTKQLFTSLFTMLFLQEKLTRVCLYSQQTIARSARTRFREENFSFSVANKDTPNECSKISEYDQ